MTKVSILVPIYNVEKYLRECLDSLANQTLKDIEIICINDGSTDSSADIIAEYIAKDNRFKIIDKENSGYGHSMNQGLNAASGEYIGIVESDDFANTNMFEELYKLAKKFDADIAKSDYYCYTTSNNQSRKAGKILPSMTNKVINAQNTSWLLMSHPSIWSAIYKNEFLTNNNIRFLETPGASYQDTGFAFKTMALAEKVVLTSAAYLNYRQDNEASSVNSQKKVYALCDEYESLTEFLDKNPQVKEYTNTYKLAKEFIGYMWNLGRINEKFIDEFIDKFAEKFKTYRDNNELDDKFMREFTKKYDKKLLSALLNDKTEFRKYVDKMIKKQAKRKNNNKKFSIRINSSRISIVLFGKQIVEIG